jgi:hypothetical protein
LIFSLLSPSGNMRQEKPYWRIHKDGSEELRTHLCHSRPRVGPGLPKSMNLRIPGLQVHIQELDYEKVPFLQVYNQICHKHGHMASSCPERLDWLRRKHTKAKSDGTFYLRRIESANFFYCYPSTLYSPTLASRRQHLFNHAPVIKNDTNKCVDVRVLNTVG